LIDPLPGGARSLCAHRHSGADELGPAGAAISQRSRLRRCAFNRCSILDTAADSKTTDAAKDPSSRQRGHREGADKEGTLAAMKALWRELADPKSRNITARRKDHTAGRDREPERQAVV